MEIGDEEKEAETFDKIEQNANARSKDGSKHKKHSKKDEQDSIELENLK